MIYVLLYITMTEDERSFFENHPDVQENAEPDRSLEFAETIDRLDQEQLGRALAIRDTDPASARVTHQTSGDIELHELPAEERETIIGYALPLKDDDTKHLLSFKDGQMCVTEPYSDENIPASERIVSNYKNNFRANAAPLTRSRKEWGSVPGAVNSLRSHGINLQARVTDTNDSPDKVDYFNEVFDAAIDVATRRKTEKDQVRRQTMNNFMTRLDQKLFPKPDQPPPSPGGEGPTQP